MKQRPSNPNAKPQANSRPNNHGYSSPGPNQSNRSPNGPKVIPNTPRGTTFRKPPIEPFATTLWTYPSQHYDAGDGRTQGDPRYIGATPSWVIWQVIHRYTRPGDRVLDPMCGSGTTLDVCRDLSRKGVGFDLVPRRPDIARADARRLPLADASVSLAFVDPPYSTHIDYSDDPDCIGRLDAGKDDAYFDAMRASLAELRRVVRSGGVVAVYVSDTVDEQGRFVPIAMRLLHIMVAELGMEPLDVISVVRNNAKLRDPQRITRAKEGGPFERGYNSLLIAKRPASTQQQLHE